MIQLLLVLAYTLLFSFIIYKAKFFDRFNINSKWLVAFFIIKVAIGIYYGYIHLEKYGGGDTWSIFRQGTLQVYHVLWVNPVSYLKLVFLPCSIPPPAGLEHYASSVGGYGDESYYFLVRFHALVRIFSFGFYNVHVVFYNFISLIGILYLIRFVKNFVQGKDILIMSFLCLFPGVAFWTSGIHKDGLALAALGLLLYSFLNLLKNDMGIKNFISIVISVWVIAILRSFIFLVMVPALIAFAWTYLKPGKVAVKYVFIHLMYYGLMFNIHRLLHEINMLKQLAFMQQEFSKLIVTHTTIALTRLEPSLRSLLSLIPEGLAHSITRPYLWEIFSAVEISSALDNIILLLLTPVVFLLFRERKSLNNPFFYFCLFYMLSLFVLVGIIVPNLGALVRYKNTGMMFWALMLIYTVDWERVKKLFIKANNDTKAH